jgi:Na+-exporting ATPase
MEDKNSIGSSSPPSSRHVSGQSNRPLSKPAHALPYEDVARELNTEPLNGLDRDEAARRLGTFGKNELGEAEGVQPFKIIIAQIANAMTMVGNILTPPPLSVLQGESDHAVSRRF